MYSEHTKMTRQSGTDVNMKNCNQYNGNGSR